MRTIMLCSAVSGIVILIACVSVGAVSGNQQTEPVKTGSFEIVDKQGRVRIRIGTSEAGDPRMTFLDQEGKASLVLSASEEGGPSLEVRSTKSKALVKMRVNKDGAPGFHIFDAEGNPRILMVCDMDGSAGLVLTDAARRGAISQIVDGTSARLQLFDQESIERLKVSCPNSKEEAGGLPGFYLLDQGAKVRGSLGFTKAGDPTCAVMGPDEKSAAYLGVKGNGQVGMGLKDSEGVLRASVSVQDSLPLFRALDSKGNQVWRAP